ncbi:hypothetical protein IJS64_01030 [bacterium]|nr:hypothetical protein [bacterium]
MKVNAANHHQINGAMMKIHTIFRLSRHSNNAGQKLLAGFTDVQVNQSQSRCTRIKAPHITNHATGLNSSFEVTPNTAYTNTNVRIISARSPTHTFPNTQSRLFEPKIEYHHNKKPRIAAQRIPQIN